MRWSPLWIWVCVYALRSMKPHWHCEFDGFLHTKCVKRVYSVCRTSRPDIEGGFPKRSLQSTRIPTQAKLSSFRWNFNIQALFALIGVETQAKQLIRGYQTAQCLQSFAEQTSCGSCAERSSLSEKNSNCMEFCWQKHCATDDNAYAGGIRDYSHYFPFMNALAIRWS